MIVLHRPASCTFCDEVEESLTDWVLAYRVVQEDIQEPRLAEGTQVYQGEEAIRAMLKTLHEEVHFSRQVQSDACIIDPDDPGQCL